MSSDAKKKRNQKKKLKLKQKKAAAKASELPSAEDETEKMSTNFESSDIHGEETNFENDQPNDKAEPTKNVEDVLENSTSDSIIDDHHATDIVNTSLFANEDANDDDPAAEIMGSQERTRHDASKANSAEHDNIPVESITKETETETEILAEEKPHENLSFEISAEVIGATDSLTDGVATHDVGIEQKNTMITDELVDIQHEEQPSTLPEVENETQEDTNSYKDIPHDEVTKFDEQPALQDKLSEDDKVAPDSLFNNENNEELMPWESNLDASPQVAIDSPSSVPSGNGMSFHDKTNAHFTEKSQEDVKSWDENTLDSVLHEQSISEDLAQDLPVTQALDYEQQNSELSHVDNQEPEQQIMENQDEDVLFTDESSSGQEPLPWEASGEQKSPDQVIKKENDEIIIQKKFSFLDNDDDFLEDDDSFLGSDEDISAVPEVTSYQREPESSPQMKELPPRLHDSSNAYAPPQVALDAVAQAQTLSPNFSIIQPVARIIGVDKPSEQKEISSKYAPLSNSQPNELNSPSIGGRNSIISNQSQPPIIASTRQDQVIHKKLDEEKKKSDAYDIPFEMVMRKPVKISHAKPFGVPNSSVSSRSPSGSLSPSQLRPGPAGRTFSASSGPAPLYQQSSAPTVPAKHVRVAPVQAAYLPMSPANEKLPNTIHPVLEPGNQSVNQIPKNNVPRSNPYAPLGNNQQRMENQGIPGPTTPFSGGPSSVKRYAPLTTSKEPPKSGKFTYPLPSQDLRARAFSNVSNGSAGSFGSQGNYGIPQISQAQHGNVALHSVPSQLPSVDVASSNLPALKVLGLPVNGQPLLSPNTQKRSHARSNSSVYAPAHSSRYAPTVQPQYHEPHLSNGEGIHNTTANYAAGFLPQQQQQQVPFQPDQQIKPYHKNGNQHSVTNSSFLQRQFPIFHWGKSSKVVYALASAPESNFYLTTENSVPFVNVVGYDAILKAPSALKSFPGPLIRHKTKRKEIVKWLDDFLEYSLKEQPLQDPALWAILKAKLSDKPSTKEFARILYNSDELLPYLSQPMPTYKLELNAHKLNENTQLRVLAFLQTGHHEEALELALTEKDYAMALMLSSMSGKEKWSTVVNTYLTEEFKSATSNGDFPVNLLTLIFQVFVGNTEKVIQDIKSDHSKQIWAIQNWKMILSAVLYNSDETSDDTSDESVHQLSPVVLEFLLKFGVFLLERNVFLGGAVAFVIANVPMSTNDIVLDSTIKFESIGNPNSLDAILFSELYEYTYVTKDPKFTGFECLIPLKMTHASVLADYGMASTASKYTDMLTAYLRSLPKNSLLSIKMASHLDFLTSRLLGSNGSWLGKPKLSNVWGQLDKSFNRFIGGDDDEVINKPSEKTVFDSFTPSSSRNASMLDLSQHTMGLNSTVPMTAVPLQHGQPAFVQERVSSYISCPSETNLQAINAISSINSSKRPSVGAARSTGQKFVPQDISSPKFASPVPGPSVIASPLKGTKYTLEAHDNSIQSSSLSSMKTQAIPSATTPPPLFSTSSKKLRTRHNLPRGERADSLDDLYNLGPEPKLSSNRDEHLRPVKKVNDIAVKIKPNDWAAPPSIPIGNSMQTSKKSSRRSSIQSVGSIGSNSCVSASPRIVKQAALIADIAPPPKMGSSNCHISPGQQPAVLNQTPVGKIDPLLFSVEEPPSRLSKVSEPIDEEVEYSRNSLDNATNMMSPEEDDEEDDERKDDDVIQKVVTGKNLSGENTSEEGTASNFEGYNKQHFLANRYTSPTKDSRQVSAEQHTLGGDEIPQPDNALESSNTVDFKDDGATAEPPLERLASSRSTNNLFDNINSEEQGHEENPSIETTNFTSSEGLRQREVALDVNPYASQDSLIMESLSEQKTQMSGHSVEPVNTVLSPNPYAPRDALASMTSLVNGVQEQYTPTGSANAGSSGALTQPDGFSSSHPYAPRSSVASKATSSPYAPGNKDSKRATPSPYAPANREVVQSPTSNPYAPKSSSPQLQAQTQEDTLGELDMFAYGGYKIQDPVAAEQSTNTLRVETVQAELDIIDDKSDQSSASSEVMQPKPLSPIRSRFDPVIESDPVLNKPFSPMTVPVIRPASNPNFKPFTPASEPNTEEYYDDVVEDESDEEENNQEEERAKLEAAKRNEKLEAQKKQKEKEKKSNEGHGGHWFGWLKKETNEKKPIKAKLGHQNTFYYDDKQKRWVNKNSSGEEKQEVATPPPPPPVIKRKQLDLPELKPRSGSIAGGAASRTAGVVAPMNPLTGKPILPNTDNQDDIPDAPLNRDININLSSKKANGLDDLISLAGRPGSTSGTRRKKKANRGYVNVMNNA